MAKPTSPQLFVESVPVAKNTRAQVKVNGDVYDATALEAAIASAKNARPTANYSEPVPAIVPEAAPAPATPPA